MKNDLELVELTPDETAKAKSMVEKMLTTAIEEAPFGTKAAIIVAFQISKGLVQVADSHLPDSEAPPFKTRAGVALILTLMAEWKIDPMQFAIEMSGLDIPGAYAEGLAERAKKKKVVR